MKKTLIICSLLSLVLPLMAQNAGQADALFLDGRYADALPLYESLHRGAPKNVLYSYRLARCEQELGMKEKAIAHFEQAGERYALRNFFLGELYYETYRFAEAKERYEAFLECIPETHERYESVEEQIRRADRAARLMTRVEDVTIVDTVRLRKEDLMRYLPLSADQGKIEIADGQYSYMNQRGDRRYLAVTDPVSQRMLICCQQRLLDEWSAPDTLPESVNRFARQAYPFLMPDGLTLYYAAQSENGLGEWDIYMTKYNPATGGYLNPEMLGMPFNSLTNDYLFYIDETANRGYFFSDRQAEMGQLIRYTFVPNEEKNLLREEDDDYVRNYARLKLLRTAATPLPKEEDMAASPLPVSVLPQEEEPAFRFVVNDSVIYTSLEEFRSKEARDAAAQYLDLQEQIEEEEEDLQKNRGTYMEAEDVDTRNALRPMILSLETDVRRLKKEADKLLLQVRILENSNL